MKPTPFVTHELHGPFDAETGDLRIARWATHGDYRAPIASRTGMSTLLVHDGARPTPMAHSPAGVTGAGLASNGMRGVRVIRVPAGRGFPPHTHPGDHLLIVVAGFGTIAVGGRVYATQAGEVYMIAGSEPHAVGAVSDHVILAVGSPHAP